MRDRFAQEYEAAPRIRWSRPVTVPAAIDRIDLTPLCPTQDDLGPAPSFDLIIAFVPNDPATPLSVAVGPGAAPAPSYWPAPGTVNTDSLASILVRRLRPRDPDTGRLVDGSIVQLVPGDANGTEFCQAGLELPNLNWR